MIPCFLFYQIYCGRNVSDEICAARWRDIQIKSISIGSNSLSISSESHFHIDDLDPSRVEKLVYKTNHSQRISITGKISRFPCVSVWFFVGIKNGLYSLCSRQKVCFHSRKMMLHNAIVLLVVIESSNPPSVFFIVLPQTEWNFQACLDRKTENPDSHSVGSCSEPLCKLTRLGSNITLNRSPQCYFHAEKQAKGGTSNYN